ncbi:MAG: FtsW/RodA/SpoVE family cell cycle protein [Defluviitaleaceae bacterium]|nr:FtsW/RodA/SpoVE family cell cycle protein [Defluviitaleaceae bacterium]
MLEFFIIAFRYFFVFYIVYFLWQGICYILIERGKLNKNKKIPIKKQRITIVFLHLKGVLLLSGGYNIAVLTTGGLWVALFIVYIYIAEKIYKNSCPLIWNGFFFLTSVSNIVLMRLSQNLANLQLMWLAVACGAILIMPLVLKIVYKLEKLEYIYLVLGLGLLLSTFVLGTEEFGSIRRIEIHGFGFAPAQLTSFTYILYLATVFRKKLSFNQLIFPSAMAVAHVVILVAQRNLGDALIFFMSYMIIMYIATGRELLFLAGIGLFGAGSVLAYNLFHHVRVRVAVWQNPWGDVHGTGHQTIQSLFAIGTWGVFGSGLTLGLPNLVPVVARDLTFAAIAEEFGIIFAGGIIGIYIMIFYRGVHIALRCKRRYYSLLAVGFTGVLAFQTFLIIGGTINLIPLTGVTLPFISYGGSSLVMSTVMLGMLQWILNYYETAEESAEK